jgi:Flp pilus assembly protein TadB
MKQVDKGTHEHPKSALNLRLIFALFGLVSSTALAITAFVVGYVTLGVVLAVIAGVALVNTAVVGVRVVRRRRRGERHTLFE